MIKKQSYDPFIGYETLLTICLQSIVGIIINLVMFQIFLPTYLYQPLLQPELLTSMSRMTFIVLVVAGGSIFVGGYFTFIFYVIGSHILIKLLIKKLREHDKSPHAD